LAIPKQYGSDPATYHYTVTANSSNVLVNIPRAVYAANAGVIELADAGNTFISYTVTAGQVLAFRPTRIGSNTTANTILWY
jgi:hypothetical protein